MDTKTKFINIIREKSNLLKENFEVKSILMFGSVARGEDNDLSDVDLMVEMPPKAFSLMDLEDFLSGLLHRKVDIIRKRDNINSFLLHEINKDGIKVF